MIESAVNHIVNYCGGLDFNEKVVLLYDSSTEGIMSSFKKMIEIKTYNIELFMLKLARIHGEEPPEDVSRAMMEADLVICLTQFSLAHSEARLNTLARGTRFLSLPMYSEKLLSNPAVIFPYKTMYDFSQQITDKLTLGKRITVTSDVGTNLTMNISERSANCCPGYVTKEMQLGSPPDIEVNIAPIEGDTNGKLIVDGSITCSELGLLEEVVELTIVNGKIASIHSNKMVYKKTLEDIFDSIHDEKAYVLAECGIGLNKNAELCGNMLIDEGTYGCVHFGFGSNFTIQGKNKVGFHLDFVITKPTLSIDGVVLIQEGEFLI